MHSSLICTTRGFDSFINFASFISFASFSRFDSFTSFHTNCTIFQSVPCPQTCPDTPVSGKAAEMQENFVPRGRLILNHFSPVHYTNVQVSAGLILFPVALAIHFTSKLIIVIIMPTHALSSTLHIWTLLTMFLLV